ncbi:MAG TPA: cupin domain-containing protein [Gemmatimonadota bacterium]|nr:cupin domain-containing protein [Gemmatimonadota bacterium]
MKSGVRRPDPESESLTEERCYIVEVSGRPEDPELSIARARVEPGVTTQLHALDGIAERYLIVEGEGRMETGHAMERRTAAVGPGDVVLIPPGVPQRITNTGIDDLVFYCLCTPAWNDEAYGSLEPDGDERDADRGQEYDRESMRPD